MNLRSLLPGFLKRNLNDPLMPIGEALEALFSGRKSAAGIDVTPHSALESASVWAAVRRISSTLASLPLPVYRETEHGKEKAKDHPAYHLLTFRPNKEHSAFTFKELLATHLLIYGDAFAEIERNGAGQPVALWPIFPTNVRIERVGTEKVYVVRVQNGDVVLPASDILHVPGFGLDGNRGLVPVTMARNAIGLTRALEEYGSSFFANGAQPSGILTIDKALTPEKREKFRTEWAGHLTGKGKTQGIQVLEGGWKWEAIGIPPEHAQFLETRRFSVDEVARFFLLPPHLIGSMEHATFGNIEHQSQEYATHCIEPWTRRIEQELNYKLWPERSHYAEFNLEGLLRGDSQARAEFYTKMFNLGAMSVNEIRRLENLNALGPAGDQRFIPMNLAPLDPAQRQEATSHDTV